MSNNQPETPDQTKQRQSLHRAKSQLEAELGGRAVALNADDVAIWLAWHHDGMLDIGGTCPKSSVPTVLRELADRLEAVMPR